MSCRVCDHSGWVCESHLDRPWGAVSEHEDACGCGGGTPCLCNDDPENAGALAELIIETYRPETVH